MRRLPHDTKMEKLAVDGGKPIRETMLPYGRQYIDEADKQAVLEVLQDAFLTCGPRVEQLEERLCALTGAGYAVAVSNGTAALHVACLAAGIGVGDEVIVPPITFAASANCVLYCGAHPVFADIEKDTWTIAPEAVRKLITPKTKAIVAVDYTGQTCNLNALRAICDEYKLLLIEDAAHSIGTEYDGRGVGSIADLTTFSFHPVKTVTAGEGGAILTNDKALYERLQLFAKHGITRDAAQQQTEGGWYYEQTLLGYNYRLTDIQCALCMSQLDKLPQFAQRRKELTRQYDEAFAKVPQIILQQAEPACDTVRHLYVLRFDLAKLNATRKQIYDALLAENIGVNVHYIPIYYFPHYAALGYARGLCPQAEALYEEIITIPLFYAMRDQDAKDVIRAVRKVIAAYKK